MEAMDRATVKLDANWGSRLLRISFPDCHWLRFVRFVATAAEPLSVEVETVIKRTIVAITI
jgi:hypothetical protein